MELVERYRGFEIRRTTVGHLVVVDPWDETVDRLNLVELLAANAVLDALFFPTLDEARAVIDGYMANGLIRPE